MKKITILLTALLIILSLESCRKYIKNVPPAEEVTTYGELFSAWWDKMNKYYIFWDLDSPRHEWDDVYNEYLPLFEECGEIEGSDEETQARVIDCFYDIITPLSDGHYYMDLNLPGRDTVKFVPSLRRVYTNLGLTPEETKDAMLNRRSDEYAAIRDSAFRNENTLNIMKDIFGIASTPSGEPLYRPFSAETAQEGNIGDYFVQAGYFITPEDYAYDYGERREEISSFAVFAGLTEDGIAYLAFSDFTFAPFVYNGTQNDDPVGMEVLELLESFFNLITEPGAVSGAIIDLRGNGGGMVNDLQILWSFFTAEDVKIGEIRGKKIESRQAYSAWHDLTIKATGSAETNFDKPIAVLVNGHSASCAEMSTYFFKAFRDNHGGNVMVIGDRTIGAHGPLEGQDAGDKYGSGSFQIDNQIAVDGNDYIIFSNTPIYETKAYDGVIREGIGIEPDDSSIPFSITEFRSGTDARLNRAFEWIRTGN